jgi:hypothetical protein
MLARQSNMGEEATQKRSGQRKIAQTRNGDGSFWQMLSLSLSLSFCVCIYIYIPVVPHKAVAEVSKIGKL